jgi:hypothetical protein
LLVARPSRERLRLITRISTRGRPIIPHLIHKSFTFK